MGTMVKSTASREKFVLPIPLDSRLAVAPPICYSRRTDEGMAELADAQDLGSCGVIRVGSTPTTRTRQGPGAKRAPGLFLFMQKVPASKQGIFFSPCFQNRHRFDTIVIMTGVFL